MESEPQTDTTTISQKQFLQERALDLMKECQTVWRGWNTLLAGIPGVAIAIFISYSGNLPSGEGPVIGPSLISSLTRSEIARILALSLAVISSFVLFTINITVRTSYHAWMAALLDIENGKVSSLNELFQNQSNKFKGLSRTKCFLSSFIFLDSKLSSKTNRSYYCFFTKSSSQSVVFFSFLIFWTTCFLGLWTTFPFLGRKHPSLFMDNGFMRIVLNWIKQGKTLDDTDFIFCVFGLSFLFIIGLNLLRLFSEVWHRFKITRFR